MHLHFCFTREVYMTPANSCFQPLGEKTNANSFFQEYLAAPLVIFLYFIWKVITRFRGPLFIRARDMDVDTGRRELDYDPADVPVKTLKNLPMRIIGGLF